MFSNFHDNVERESFQIHIKLKHSEHEISHETKQNTEVMCVFVSRKKEERKKYDHTR